MSNNDKLAVSMVHELCPVCLKETNHQIIMNSKLTKKHAQEVEQMNNKAIGFSEPCEECTKYLEDGYIALIGIDPAKSNAIDGHVKLHDLYRTGKFAWGKREPIESIFGSQENRPFILLEDEAFDALIQKAEETPDEE